jgi:hypothetical protein
MVMGQRIIWGGGETNKPAPGNASQSLTSAALILAASGLPVFPCNSDKHPIVDGGFKSATRDPKLISEMFSRPGAALIGIPTGRASGWVVIDVDPRHGGDAWLRENQQQLPPTRTHCTPSGGLHFVFRDPPDVEIRNSQGRIAVGVDVRGTGGYVVVPPSKGYGIKHNGPLADMPPRLIEACRKPEPPSPSPRPRQPPLADDATPYALKALSDECIAIHTAPFGQQEITLNNAALKIGGLAAAGELAESYALAELIAAGHAIPSESGREPWRAAEVEKKVKRAFADGKRTPRNVPPPISVYRQTQQPEPLASDPKLDAQEAETEGPRPLRRELPPAAPFPISAFDCVPVLRDAITAIEMRTRAPLAICGNSVLAAAAVCAQAHADVVMPYNELRPLSDYFVSVAESGERKTSADDAALRPIRRHEAKLREDYAAAMLNYLQELDTYTAFKSHLQKTLKKDRQALRKAMAELGSGPSKPLKSTILLDNPTVEGLEIYAAEGRPSFGLFTAEGGKLIGGHLLNDDNRMKAGATLNLLWDGKPMPRFRRDYGDKLPGRRFAMHVMVQPEIAARMLADETLSNLGTLARCLVVAPDSTAGARFWRDVPASVEPALSAYDKALGSLLDRNPPTGSQPNELKPRALPLSPVARAMWIAFHDEAERKLTPGGEWASIRALGAKLPEHVARIGGALTIVTDPDAAEIGVSALEGGMMLANYYAAEALRLVDAGLTNPDLILAEKLLAWLHADARREVAHLREIYQFGPGSIRDKATAARIAAILEDHGWLRRLEAWTVVDGSRRRDVWAVIR